MKKVIFYSILLFITVGCSNSDENNRTPEVRLNFNDINDLTKEDYILLREYTSRDILDTLKYDEASNSFLLALNDTLENAYYLSINKKTIPNSTFITKNEDVAIQVDYNADQLRDSKTKIQSENLSFKSYENYKRSVEKENHLLDSLVNKYYEAEDNGLFENDENLRKTLDDNYEIFDKQRIEKTKQFIDSTQNSASLLVYNRELIFSSNYDTLNEYLNKFKDPSIHKTKLFKKLDNTRTKMKGIAIGSQAPNFSAPNPDGEQISLEDYKGQYVLVDFWASWCGPCRAANPELVEIYEEFHPKGVEFLGVSYDYPGSKEDWIKAIKEDKLPWPQVSELKGWDTDTKDLYSVFGIPYQILLDKEGRVIAGNNIIREKGLKEILHELQL